MTKTLISSVFLSQRKTIQLEESDSRSWPRVLTRHLDPESWPRILTQNLDPLLTSVRSDNCELLEILKHPRSVVHPTACYSDWYLCASPSFLVRYCLCTVCCVYVWVRVCVSLCECVSLFAYICIYMSVLCMQVSKKRYDTIMQNEKRPGNVD